jgi:hypothetical protein
VRPRMRHLRRVGREDLTWWLRHRHEPDGPCTEVLSIKVGTGVVRISFREDSTLGRIVSGGYWMSGHVAVAPGEPVNLNRPGVVAAVAVALEPDLLARGGDVDGWELLGRADLPQA